MHELTFYRSLRYHYRCNLFQYRITLDGMKLAVLISMILEYLLDIITVFSRAVKLVSEKLVLIHKFATSFICFGFIFHVASLLSFSHFSHERLQHLSFIFSVCILHSYLLFWLCFYDGTKFSSMCTNYPINIFVGSFTKQCTYLSL